MLYIIYGFSRFVSFAPLALAIFYLRHEDPVWFVSCLAFHRLFEIENQQRYPSDI